MTPDEIRAALKHSGRSTFDASVALRRLAAVLAIRCGECGVAWNDPGERWRGLQTDGERSEVIMLCPDCAELESGY